MHKANALAYYYDHPVEFTEDIIRATPEPEQRAIMNSVAKHPMTSVRSGHGVGKSAVESWLIIWFLCTRPFPKIPCTAPTQHQLFDILWAEISKWIRNSPVLEQTLTWTQEKIYFRGHREEWFAVPRTATKPDALQGFHAEHVLYVIDEASGVKDDIFEPVLGSLSTPGARLLMCGNPTQLSGFFYDSHHKNRAQYQAFHIDGRNSPRVDKGFITRTIQMYGEDSDVFRVRVAGEFPKQEADVFIPLSLVEAGIHTERDTAGHITFGVDVARYGDDKTVIATKAGNAVDLPIIRHGQNLMRTVGDIVQLYRQTINAYPKYKGRITVNIDDTGLGGGVTDRLQEVVAEQRLSRMHVVAVNFGGKINDPDAADNFANMGTYLWSFLRHELQEGTLSLPNHTEMVAQLSIRKYGVTSAGKIILESKEAMKKRGVHSPDIGDAVALACYKPKVFSLEGLIR